MQPAGEDFLTSIIQRVWPSLTSANAGLYGQPALSLDTDVQAAVDDFGVEHMERDKQFTPRYQGLFMPYTSDIEFYGYGGNTVKEVVPVSRLKTLLDCLCEADNLELILPSQYLAKQDDSLFKKQYLKAGSWSSDKDFDLWLRESDNALLNEQCYEAYKLYKRFALPGQSAITTPKGEYLDQEKLLRDLLLAYDSDGRGWTPLPEHRLFCFNKALSVKDLLSE